LLDRKIQNPVWVEPQLGIIRLIMSLRNGGGGPERSSASGAQQAQRVAPIKRCALRDCLSKN